MRLNVPTNWDDTLLGSLVDLPVQSVYGKLPREVIGGGRPAAALPDVSKSDAARHIQLAHRLGFEFNYILNASCLGNQEYQPEYLVRIRRLLDWLAELKVESLTISIPYLIELAARNYPQFRIAASVFSHIDCLDQARYYQDLGVSEIAMVQAYNRNFKFLSQFQEGFGGDTQLIVNNACLFGCPYRRYHANLNSHASQMGYGDLAFDYPVISCSRERIASPVELIKSPWIRPEDLHYYEELGFAKFKLSGRTETTAWIVMAATAYAQRRSPQNVARLLTPPNCSHSLHQKHYPGIPRVELVIDNEALGDFLPAFFDRDCNLSCCMKCGYCREVAERAVKTDPELSSQAVAGYDRLLEEHFSAVAVPLY